MREGMILPDKMDELMIVPPRHLIYCWKCDVVEVMDRGVASDEFGGRHVEHKQETQIIQIRYMTSARAA